jgi:hypothetical protein
MAMSMLCVWRGSAILFTPCRKWPQAVFTGSLPSDCLWRNCQHDAQLLSDATDPVGGTFNFLIPSILISYVFWRKEGRKKYIVRMTQGAVWVRRFRGVEVNPGSDKWSVSRVFTGDIKSHLDRVRAYSVNKLEENNLRSVWKNLARYFIFLGGGGVDGSNLAKIDFRRINLIWPELFTDLLLTETYTKYLISVSDIHVISFPQVSTVLLQ